MRRLLFAICVCALILSCSDEDGQGNIEVTFKATYNGVPLVSTDKYTYGFDQEIQLTKTDFFISQLELIRSTGASTPLSDLEFLDLTYSDLSSAFNGETLSFTNVPARSYSGIRFGVGVDPILNSQIPEDFPPENPLSNPGRYWHAWTSYIFARTEGNLDTLNNGISEIGMGWLYHTGTDELYATITGPANIEIIDGQTTQIEFTLDYYKLLGMPSDPIDIKSKPINHNPLDTNEILTLVGNYSNAFTFVVE